MLDTAPVKLVVSVDTANAPWVDVPGPEILENAPVPPVTLDAADPVTLLTGVTGVATAVAATWVELGLYYDGTDLLVYANSQIVARVSAPTIGSTGTTLTNALLSPVFQITPVATDTLSADFVLAAQEVLR